VVGGAYYGHRDPELPPRQDERKVLLRQVLKKPKDRLIYEHDFGDSWEHLVVLEQVLAHEPRARYPVIVAGKRACPPEDCGGVPGYYRLLEALASPRHPEHRDMVEWVGGSFDSESFDVGALNRVLHGGVTYPGKHAWLHRAARQGARGRPSCGS
jgi:Plasmid pRiA4b ORF-3-like protein